MPARSPRLSAKNLEKLVVLGGIIRGRRKELGVGAATTAEAAGMSRVTLHRIERGEPSVTMGAYLAALFAVGLELSVVRGDFEGPPDAEGEVIRLAEYPELRRISWHLSETTELTPGQALEIYERNWRHVDKGAMPEEEKALLARLVRRHGGGRLLV